MNSKSIYFISGVSGVGKTTAMPHLKTLLPHSFEIHDFDEGGVPAGADHEWRKQRTREWINLANQKSKEGIVVVVCGIANPEEIEPIKKDFSDLEIKTILLDGEVNIIEERLRNRNRNNVIKADLERVVGSAEDFIIANSNFLPVLREIYKKYNYPIIDTSHMEPQEVAEKIVELMK